MKDTITALHEIPAQSILNAAPIGIYFANESGDVEYVNPALLSILSVTEEEVINRNWYRLVHPEDLDNAQNSWESFIKNAKRLEMDLRITRGKGYIWIKTIGVAIKNNKGAVAGFSGYVEDVTGLKELDQAQQNFVTLASHQLRTPISSIKWLLELINTQSFKDDKERKELLNSTYQLADRMTRLINSLLMVSDIENKKKVHKLEDAVDMNSLCAKVCDDFATASQFKQVKLVKNFSAVSPLFVSDSDLSYELLACIVDNSINYTKPHGTVKISTYNEGEDVVCEISDTGMGIPKDQQHKVFHKFFRASNATRHDAGGTGLSLYLAKSISDLLNAKLTFESQEEKGTTFWIKFKAESETISALV